MVWVPVGCLLWLSVSNRWCENGSRWRWASEGTGTFSLILRWDLRFLFTALGIGGVLHNLVLILLKIEECSYMSLYLRFSRMACIAWSFSAWRCYSSVIFIFVRGSPAGGFRYRIFFVVSGFGSSGIAGRSNIPWSSPVSSSWNKAFSSSSVSSLSHTSSSVPRHI